MRKKRNTQKVLAVFIIAAMVMTFLLVDGYGLLSRGVSRIAVPLWKTQTAGLDLWGGFTDLLRSKKSLVDENKKLRAELAISSKKLLDRNFLFEENVNLKEIMGRDISDRIVIASVLSGPGQSLYDTLTVDIGKDFDIEAGDKVLYAGSIVIGEVSQVFAHSARVSLFSSYGKAIDVLVGAEKITTTAHGRGGGNYEIRLPRDVIVKEGDAVLVPGISPHIIGYVEHVEVKMSDPFKQILFRDVVNPYRIREVEIVSRSREVNE